MMTTTEIQTTRSPRHPHALSIEDVREGVRFAIIDCRSETREYGMFLNAPNALPGGDYDLSLQMTNIDGAPIADTTRRASSMGLTPYSVGWSYRYVTVLRDHAHIAPYPYPEPDEHDVSGSHDED